MSQLFPELYGSFGGNVKVDLNLSNYPTKLDLKGVTGIDTITLASNADLAGIKTRECNLDRDKLKTVTSDLSR